MFRIAPTNDSDRVKAEKMEKKSQRNTERERKRESQRGQKQTSKKLSLIDWDAGTERIIKTRRQSERNNKIKEIEIEIKKQKNGEKRERDS